jgi:uncharacterized surface protein with fasciclin (FAS1) repeats
MRLANLILCSALLAGITVHAETVNAIEKPRPVDLGIIEVLKADGRYKILVSALETTGVAKTLDVGGPYTFFAPTDEAFQRVPKLADLLKDEAHLAAVLRHHIVDAQRLDTQTLRGQALLTPLQGKALKITTEPEIRIDDDTKIVQPNREMKTGIYHGVDHVLMANNDSALRNGAAAVEEGVKDGAKKVYDGLKTGAKKIEEAVK